MPVALRDRIIDDIDTLTHSWTNYGSNTKHFNDYARPQQTLRAYVEAQFHPVQKCVACSPLHHSHSRLWRSASSNTLTSEFNLRHSLGELRRSSSYSQLAPVNGIDADYRRVKRCGKFTMQLSRADTSPPTRPTRPKRRNGGSSSRSTRLLRPVTRRARRASTRRRRHSTRSSPTGRTSPRRSTDPLT